MTAVVAGAIDASSLLSKAARVQDSLDYAAMVIAQEHRAGKSQAELDTLGMVWFRNNLRWTDTVEPTFSYSISEDASGTITVETRSRLSHDGFIGWDLWKAQRDAAVSLPPRRLGCILALHPTASSAIRMAGATDLDLENCTMAANSSASNVISRQGAATLSAACVVTVGATSGLDSRTRLSCPEPLHGRPPTPDPLESIDPPSYTGCATLPESNPKLLTPGTYCNQTFSGNIVLAPGSYILRGGEISLGGGGSLAGSGVTIFLMEGATMTLTGNEISNLSAPEAGPFAGIVIFQARNTPMFCS